MSNMMTKRRTGSKRSKG